MGNPLELLEAEALKLTAGERAAFGQILLPSLDDDAELESDQASELAKGQIARLSANRGEQHEDSGRPFRLRQRYDGQPRIR